MFTEVSEVSIVTTVRHTKHFHPNSDKKLVCSCCGKGQLAIATFIILEDVREYFGKPITILSACRCEKHNTAEGGAEDSRHLYEPYERDPDAADIVVEGVSPREVYDYLTSRPYANLLGLGSYNTFTHVDSRGYRARW